MLTTNQLVVAAIKRFDDQTVEMKRMFVRP